jgi:cytochrome d ubiquinol oxidase subunit I
MHLFSTAMVALGSSLSAFWIMDANSWMQTPVGGRFEGGAFVVESSLAAIFNPDMPWGVSHMWVACVEISLFVVGGISAWYLYRRRNVEFFLRSFKMVVIAAIVITPLQIWLGDGSGLEVAKNQPAKLAGIEAHWHTNPPGTPASWNILAWPDKAKQDNRWALKIPYALSLLDTRSLTGQVKGLREFPRQDQPPIWAPFYAFRAMVGIGFLLFFLMLWTLWAWRKGKLTVASVSSQKLLLYGWMAAIPLSYVAMESGWLTREVGRQPWIIYGVLRTGDAASLLPAGTVGTSLLTFAAIYATVIGIFLYFVRRILSRGPEVEPIPGEPEPRF